MTVLDTATSRKIAHDTLDAAIDAQSDDWYDALMNTLEYATEQARHAVQVARLPPVVPAAHEIIIGHCVDALPDVKHELPIEGLRLVREMGPSIVRLNIHNERIMLPDGTYDFSRLDRDLETLYTAGFRQVLLNPMWLPRHVTGGVPINEPYEAVEWQHAKMCATCGDPPEALQHDPNSFTGLSHGNGYHVYKPRGWVDYTPEERPWLFPPNHPSVNSYEIRRFGTAFAQHVSDTFDRVMTFLISFWNEPDIRWFYPQINGAGEDWLEAVRTPLYTQMWAPFILGWKSVLPSTPVVGPDSASPGNLDLFLQLQRRYTSAAADPRKWPRYDILSFHVYGPQKPPTIAGSLNEINRLGGYMDVIRRYYTDANMPPLWATELAADSDSPTAEWCKALLNLTPRITPFPYLLSRYFEGGNDAWDSGKFVPNAEYAAMQRLVRDEGEKRRAVRTT